MTPYTIQHGTPLIPHGTPVWIPHKISHLIPPETALERFIVAIRNSILPSATSADARKGEMDWSPLETYMSSREVQQRETEIQICSSFYNAVVDFMVLAAAVIFVYCSWPFMLTLLLCVFSFSACRRPLLPRRHRLDLQRRTS